MPVKKKLKIGQYLAKILTKVCGLVQSSLLKLNLNLTDETNSHTQNFMKIHMQFWGPDFVIM